MEGIREQVVSDMRQPGCLPGYGKDCSMQGKKTSEKESVCDAAAKQLCSELAGRRILIMRSAMGAESMAEKAAVRGLQLLKKQQSASFELLEQTERDQDGAVQPGDFVILACSSIHGEDIDDGTKSGSLSRASWKEFLVLSGLLEDLRKADPAAVLLLSDTGVYGKIFGALHALKEDEMGYVCHTDPGDSALQCMRTMEHLCGRLGREEGFPVKIARVSGNGFLNPEDHDEKFCERLAFCVLKVMLRGTPGEVYNLPGMEEPEDLSRRSDHSPLSPIPIIPDAGKEGRL